MNIEQAIEWAESRDWPDDAAGFLYPLDSNEEGTPVFVKTFEKNENYFDGVDINRELYNASKIYWGYMSYSGFCKHQLKVKNRNSTYWDGEEPIAVGMLVIWPSWDEVNEFPVLVAPDRNGKAVIDVKGVSMLVHVEELTSVDVLSDKDKFVNSINSKRVGWHEESYCAGAEAAYDKLVGKNES